ncbi:hypothetical protein KKE48_04575 [Patescibacteria group bacterium]|nr:hypothetical protein [Patescibacteria group bacterium]MBU1500113.1 hypothetical protein [Patescibacteria group bacterium]
MGEKIFNSIPESEVLTEWIPEDELNFQMGDMHGEVPVLSTAKVLKKNLPPEPELLTEWTPEDELNFQMGDMHGEA